MVISLHVSNHKYILLHFSVNFVALAIPDQLHESYELTAEGKSEVICPLHANSAFEFFPRTHLLPFYSKQMYFQHFCISALLE